MSLLKKSKLLSPTFVDQDMIDFLFTPQTFIRIHICSYKIILCNCWLQYQAFRMSNLYCLLQCQQFPAQKVCTVMHAIYLIPCSRRMTHTGPRRKQHIKQGNSIPSCRHFLHLHSHNPFKIHCIFFLPFKKAKVHDKS